MFESKNVGRGLSAATGGTIGYLVNRIQTERQPADLLGLFLKTSACYFLGQYAIEKENEVVLRSVIGYMSYEAVRSLPYGKVDGNANLSGLFPNDSLQGVSVPQAPINTYTYTPYENPNAIGSVLTPENLQNVGVALRGISSFINGFQGKKE
jgi:hypothetical protein